MSIFRLLPLAASAEALRLEVQMQSPTEVIANAVANARASILSAPRSGETAFFTEHSAKTFLTGVSQEVALEYRASQTLFITTLLQQMLSETWIRDACIADRKDGVDLSSVSQVAQGSEEQKQAIARVAEQIFQSSTATLRELFSLPLAGAGFTDFVLCNGLQPIYEIGCGEIRITKYELLLRVILLDGDIWRTGLSVVFGGPQMGALAKFGFVDAMFLYCLNLHDACILRAGTLAAQEALACASINLNYNMLKVDKDGFFCNLANLNGFNLLEITEKNHEEKSRLEFEPLDPDTIPEIDGVTYLLDDYDSPHPFTGRARHPGQKLLHTNRTVIVKSSVPSTNRFSLALLHEDKRGALINYLKDGRYNGDGLIDAEVKGFIDAIRGRNVPEVVFEGAMNATMGSSTLRAELVCAWADVINAVKNNLGMKKSVCQQGGNVPEVPGEPASQSPFLPQEGIPLSDEEEEWNTRLLVTQKKPDLIHSGMAGAQAQLSVFYGSSTPEIRFSPAADTLMKAAVVA